MSVIETFRARQRPQFTEQQAREFVQAKMLEEYTPPEPTLAEAHQMWVDACHHRDRLQSVGREAEERIAAIRANYAAAIKRRPQHRRQFEYDMSRACNHHEQRLAAAQRELAELNSLTPWDELQEREKRYQAAVADAAKAHHAERVKAATVAVEAARAKHGEAAGKVSLELPWNEQVRLAGEAAEKLLLLQHAERYLAGLGKAVKGR